jgi:precorrin-2 dehydrogenase
MKRTDRLKRAKDTAYYPLALNVKGKLAVIAGGGKVAIMKVQALLKAGAIVRIVSPDLIPQLEKLHKTGKIEWIPRNIRSVDLKEAIIVIAATNDENVNKKVSDWANKKNILINVVDQPAISNFISPAVFRKKEAIIAVFTNGISPPLSRDIKNFLETRWNEFLAFRKY